MKLLFENWRQYLNENESITPILDEDDIEKIITGPEFSFNSLKTSKHRWGTRRPKIDYYIDEQSNNWKYIAYILNNPDKPDLESEENETLEDFLTRVKDFPHQLRLDLKKEKIEELALPFSSQAKMEKAVKDLSPAQEGILKKLLDSFKDCPPDEVLNKAIAKWALAIALPGASVPLIYNIFKKIRCKLAEDLYYGTSTIFQEEIAENGIKSPSEWGNYDLAEKNAFKIVEEHGGEPVIIQIPLSEFKKEHFLLDENNAVTIVYTEDLPIFMEKQQQKLL